MAYSGATPTSVPLSGDDLSDGSISEAKLADDAVSLAKMKAGVDGTIISYDASTNPVAIATGSDGQVLTSAGAGASYDESSLTFISCIIHCFWFGCDIIFYYWFRPRRTYIVLYGT